MVDVLFIDEAGQVSLGHLLTMGASARNIVLVGDQMQLGQPIQGTHPGDAGQSALDYLLQDEAVVAPERGIFLDRTWRMHPHLCRFISDMIYSGQLESEAGTTGQRLLLDARADPRLRPTGLRFIELAHEHCAQKNEEEARVVLELYDSLLRQRWRARDGHERPVTTDDILIVAPYNVQVNHLKAVLPPSARGRHHRQVPGPAGRGGPRLDDLVVGRGHPARDRVPLQPQPPERVALPRAMPLGDHREPAPARNAVPHRRAAPARQPAVRCQSLRLSPSVTTRQHRQMEARAGDEEVRQDVTAGWQRSTSLIGMHREKWKPS